MTNDEFYLRQALSLARVAEQQGEVPIGALVVLNDQIIGEGYNCSISYGDPTAHAEINALRAAAKTINNYRLLDATLYVTLEPCLMCAGAMINARIKRLVFAAFDPKAGAAGSIINAFALPELNHRVDVYGGILADESKEMLRKFFQMRRNNK